MRSFFFCRSLLTALLSLLQIAILSAQEGHIKGKVSNGNESVPAATVRLGNETKLTNINGEFSFSVKAGSYTLMITHAGYKKIEDSFSINAGDTQIINYILIPIDQLDEVVVLGSRSGIERSNLNTAVPIDAFSSDKLVRTGQVDLTQMLNYSIPSLYTGRLELNQSVTLRGLNPDQVLILLNETRYHNSAYLNNGTPKYNLGPGSVANDLNSIPFPAIEKVELLRDGATAQHGSDAIAGVFNIQLKESTGKTSIEFHTGQSYENDGEKLRLGIYRGFKIGKSIPSEKQGFLGLSANFLYQTPTTRDGEYQYTVYKKLPPLGSTAADSASVKAKDDSIINARGIDKKEFSKYNGSSKVISPGILVNAGYPIGSHSELFLTGTATYRENRLAAVYRYPKNTDQVDTALFPDGFRPEVKTTNWDITAITGLRGETKKNCFWEINSSFGSNTNDKYVHNSNNASLYALGKNAPTSFYLGKLIYNLFVNTIHFSKNLAQKDGDLRICNLATGIEWRIENYQQKAGVEASWKKYDNVSSSIQGGSQPSIGSVSDTNVVNENRSVLGTYIDLELETKENLLVDIAARYEYYSDFGGNLAGKLAVRYKFSERFSLRWSVSNGFRAPSIQQRFFQGTQSYRATTVTSGIFNYNNEVTKKLLIPSLEAEKSINFSGGITSKISNNISLTMDAYWIQIKDRITLSGVFDRSTDPYVNTVLNDYPDIDVAQFYVNAINTRTYGLDVVLNGRWTINKTRLGLILAANFNHNFIFGKIKATGRVSDTSRYTRTLFGIEEKTTLEKDQPGKKIVLTATANKGKFGFVLRNTFFGNTASTDITTTLPIDTIYQIFSSRILTDISIIYSPKSWLTITAGANNVFDVYPDRLHPRLNSGGVTLYSNGATPFGSNGGYYYVSMSFNF